jgi:F0F1-type ATP synthase assembly protein I
MIPEKPKPRDSWVSLYAKYSSLGIQIVVIVLLCTGLGYFIDQHLMLSKPYFTGGFAIIGCVLAMIYMVKSVLR